MRQSATGGSDLHVHTCMSDGAFPPADVIGRALALGLKAVAVTDHDITDGVPLAREAAGDGLEVIAGVEVSTAVAPGRDAEVHLVGLFIDLEHDELRETLATWRRQRRERVLKIVSRLNQAGIGLRAAEVFDIAGPGAISRLHVAHALVQRGVARSIGGAFHRWIGPGAPAFVPRTRPPGAELIALIHRAGGAAVLAHPAAYVKDGDVAKLAAAGLDGVEVFCMEHTPDMERRYAELARCHRLLVSGGSDYHGHGKGAMSLGSVRLPPDNVEALRRRAAVHAERNRNG